MGTSATSTYTYGSIPAAVLPGTVARGVIIGLLYVPVSAVVFAYLDDSLAGTDLEPAVETIRTSIGYGGVIAIGFLFPILASILLTYLGYGRRRYELGGDGITERRGAVLRSERFLAYDDIDEVTFTQSKMQSLYGTGSIRITDVNANEGEGTTMQFSFVDDPESVYTNVLRKISDATSGASSEFEIPEMGELPTRTDDLSGLSGDDLAAGTGFRYMMPIAVLHPDPGEAAKYGILLSLVYSAVGIAALYVLKPILAWGLHVPSELYFKAYLLAGVVAYAGVLCGWFYWKYDRVQYELYEDHIRFVEGGDRSSVDLQEVEELELREGSVRDNDVGHVGLVDDDSDTVREFKFVTDPETVHESLQEWVASARGDPASEQAPREADDEPAGDPGEKPASETTPGDPSGK